MLYSLISWIIVGLIVGTQAKLIMPGDYPGGVTGTIIIGIVGAVIGGSLLLGFIGLGGVAIGVSMWSIGAWIFTIISAIIGAVILLFIYRTLASRRV